MDPIRWLVEALLRSGLRRTFHSIWWVGPFPPSLPDGPVIAYANHHNHYDGHLAWLLFTDVLNRPTTVWMEEWDRFPFFGAVGAQPFPPSDPRRRAKTIRRTGRRFRETPETVLIYFPEGELVSPDGGVRPFPSERLPRMADLYPAATVWPFALSVAWRGHARPSAFLSGGPSHQADGHEHRYLSQKLNTLPPADNQPLHLLLRGRQSPAERWNFSFATPVFEQYL